jgi:hypothetical protein
MTATRWPARLSRRHPPAARSARNLPIIHAPLPAPIGLPQRRVARLRRKRPT